MKIFLAILFALLACRVVADAQKKPWVSAYFAGWWQGGQLNPEEINYGDVTHIIHFALGVGRDGTLTGEGNGINPASSAAAVRAAHLARKKILISVGASNSDAPFGEATMPAIRPRLVSTLVRFMTQYDYDGIDIDWEPLNTTSHYLEFISELHLAMVAAKPGALLVTAVMMNVDGSLLKKAQPYFDQINIMTYDMAGPWSRWVTWHNTALYNGGATFPSTGGPLPCADRAVRDLIAAGIPASKLGIGIDFYGYRWWGGNGTPTGGVSRPRQEWTGTPNVKDNVPYFQLMDSYVGQPVRWDSVAQAAYISIDKDGSANDEFISFDNEQTIRSKAEYVRKKGLGGVILYELGGGYRRNLPLAYRDLLLQTVGHEFLGTADPNRDLRPPIVSLSIPPDGAVLSGTTAFSAAAADNSTLAGVQFTLDGRKLSDIITKTPYSISINTWKYPNGRHSVAAIAYDPFGNSATTVHSVNFMNEGTMPTAPDRIVYDDQLCAPFMNASWGASVNLGDGNNVRSGTRSAAVDFMAWGAFDLQSGNWGAESPIDPSDYDTLRADIFPLARMKMKIAFYNGHSVEVSLEADKWNSIAVPLTFAQPFTRFYFQSDLSKPVKCYFDNVRFTAKTYRIMAME
jgi:chitinase